MSSEVFEIRAHDAAGRLGHLSVPRADVRVETPALLPVVNPHIQEIDPRRLATDFGAQIVITNAYVLHGSEELREPAERQGLHELLDFPGAIMTDSGSFQLAEYGEIDVGTTEILEFQETIGSDIATPVDIPTPPDATRTTARTDLDETTAALETAAAYDAGEMLRSAPIQGSTFPDLREEAARTAYELDLDIYPVGAMVPLLRAYRFDTVSELVCAAKRGLGVDAPVHLFGAGHPMMFALGAAIGCDLFDSAAYALYARDGRYMSIDGTTDVDRLTELPCACRICQSHSATELGDDRTALAEHNLHVSFAEMRRIREAIRSGELLELVESRVRAHPQLLDGYRSALDYPEQLEANDPVTADRPFFSLSNESSRRPAVRRHHDRLDRITPPGDVVLIDRQVYGDPSEIDPWHPIDTPAGMASTDAEQWLVVPPFGPVPPALLHTYPLTAETPNRRDRDAYLAAANGIRRLAENANGTVTVVQRDWPTEIVESLASTVAVVTAQEAPA